VTEAYHAKHMLMIGQREASLSHTLVGTQAVTFTDVEPEKIDAHIRWIEGLIAQSTGRGGRRAFYIT